MGMGNAFRHDEANGSGLSGEICGIQRFDEEWVGHRIGRRSDWPAIVKCND